MGQLADALRKKFRDPLDAIRALGLDEALIKETDMTKPTRIAFLALDRTSKAIAPLLAMDKKVDLMPIFSGLTTKNFKERKPKILADLKAALKGNTIAMDADLAPVSGMLDKIEHNAAPEASLDESVSEPQHKAMMAAANGQSNLDIPKNVGEEFKKADEGKTFDAAGMEGMKGFLKQKGLGDADIGTACDMIFKKAATDAEPGGASGPAEGLSEAEKEAAMKAGMAAGDKAARDELAKNMITKDEMSAALKTAVDAAVKAERSNNRSIAEAREFVRPYVGELGMAHDSADGVLQAAAGILKVADADKINGAGLRTIIALHPKLGAKPSELRRDEPLGMDAAARDDFAKEFPDSQRIVTG
jgi:hypothetical protein